MFSLATLYMVSHCGLISIKVVVHCQYSSSLDWKLTFLCELQFWNFQKIVFSFTSFWGCVEITKNDFWQNSIIYLHRQINLKYLPALSLSLSLFVNDTHTFYVPLAYTNYTYSTRHVHTLIWNAQGHGAAVSLVHIGTLRTCQCDDRGSKAILLESINEY